jgi:hypothetical protein
VSIALSTATTADKVKPYFDSSANMSLAIPGAEPAKEGCGTWRARDEAEDDMTTSASSGANTRGGSAANNGLHSQAKQKKTNKSRGKTF